MAEAAAADAVLNVENEIIAWAGGDAHGHRVKPQGASRFPGDNMAGASGISTDDESPDKGRWSSAAMLATRQQD
jgi:hypothetical protein